MNKIKLLGVILLVSLFASSTSFAASKSKKTLKPQAQDVEQQVISNDYANPEIIEKILNGDLDNVPYSEMRDKRYLLVIAQSISGQCNASPLTQSDYKNLSLILTMQEKGMLEDNLTNSALNYNIMNLENLANRFRIISQGGSMEAQLNYLQQDANEKSKIQMQIAQDGIKDSGVLLSNYKCGSKSLSGFSKNLVAFINEDGAKRIHTEQLASSLTPHANPNHTSAGAKFAFCLARKINHPEMQITRAQRLNLYKTMSGNDKEAFVTAFREVRNENYNKDPNFEDCF